MCLFYTCNPLHEFMRPSISFLNGYKKSVSRELWSLYFQVIFPKIQDSHVAMLHIYWGIASIWTLQFAVVCQRFITTQFNQYHTVSTEAFTEMVTHNCEHRVTHSNRTIQCTLLCSVMGRPRCLAFVLAPGSCWVCGPDYDELDPTGDMIEAKASLAYSGKCK